MSATARRPYRTTSIDMNVNPEIIKWMNALKGAPMSCLIGLHLAHPRPVGREWLSLVTGFHYDAISKAMRLLVDAYHLAARIGRFESWCLTDTGHQLKLPFFATLPEETTARAPIENGFSVFDGSSSSGLYISASSEIVQTTTTTLVENGKTAFPPEASNLIEKYMRGCKRAVAENAVRAALAREESLESIEIEMISWVLYGESPLGKGIRSASIHAAARIKSGEKCPEFLFRVNKKDKHDGDAWEAWEHANEEWIRRLEELRSETLHGWTANRNGPPNGKLFRGKFAEGDEEQDVAEDAPQDTSSEPQPKTDARAVEIWSTSLMELQMQMTKATFDTWVKPAFAISYDRERAELVVGVRNPYAKQWLENRLYGMIERTIYHIIGSATQIKFTHVSAAA